MSHHPSSDSDVATTNIQHDEKIREPKTSVRHVEAAFDIDSEDLPKGYFLRPFFIGTLIASGLSVSAVSSSINFKSSTNRAIGSGWICSCCTAARKHQCRYWPRPELRLDRPCLHFDPSYRASACWTHVRSLRPPLVLHLGLSFGTSWLCHQCCCHTHFNADWRDGINRVRFGFSTFLTLRRWRAGAIQASLPQPLLSVFVGSAFFRSWTGYLLCVSSTHTSHLAILLLSDDRHQRCCRTVLVFLVSSL
jgi:hypothetical protein